MLWEILEVCLLPLFRNYFELETDELYSWRRFRRLGYPKLHPSRLRSRPGLVRAKQHFLHLSHGNLAPGHQARARRQTHLSSWL